MGPSCTFFKNQFLYQIKCSLSTQMHYMCLPRPNREKPSFLNKEGAGGPKSKVIFVESILAQSQTIYFLTLSTLAPRGNFFTLMRLS